MTYTITTSISNVIFNPTDLSPVDIKVNVNNDENSTNYDITTDIQWINIIKEENIIRIIPLSYNNNNCDREGYIVVYNRTDSNIFAQVSVKQEHTEYQVAIENSDIITLQPFENSITDIYIYVYGGNKDFNIKTIRKYDSNNIQKLYDNDLIIKRRNIVEETPSYKKYLLQLISYGICDIDNVYYNIIFSHKDDNDIISILEVKYDEILNKNITLPINNVQKCTNIIKQNYKKINNSVIAKINNLNNIEEYIWFEYNGEKNPSVIEMNDDNIEIKVFSQVNKNGVIRQKSDIYVKLYSGWVSARYVSNDNICTIVTLSIGKNINFNFDRYCKVDIINTDKPSLFVTTKILKKRM